MSERPTQRDGSPQSDNTSALSAFYAELNQPRRRGAAVPAKQSKDEILTGDEQIQRRIKVTNEKLLQTADHLAKGGMPPFLAKEKQEEMRDKHTLALSKWRLGLPANASEAQTQAALAKQIDSMKIDRMQKDPAKAAASQDRWAVGLPDTASQAQLMQRMQSFAANELHRYKLPPDANAKQIEEAREKYLTESIKLYFGLDKNAPYEQLCQAMADEAVLSGQTGPKDTRTLLDLPEDAPESELNKALAAAQSRQLERYHMPEGTSQQRAEKIRVAKAQMAQRHALGLSFSATEREVVQAEEENDFLDMRRDRGCPLDLPQSAMWNWKTTTEYVTE